MTRINSNREPFGEIPGLLVWADLEDGRRYELWRTPEVGTGWHLYVYQHGTEISRLPMLSETRGRMEFERRVTQHMEQRLVDRAVIHPEEEETLA